MSWGFVFPGQGSQHVGMGKFLFENFKHAQLAFEEASDTLNLNFKKLCFEGTEADLALTQNTQPALLLISTSLYRCLKANADFSLNAVAGHSLGEYSALVASESVLFVDALKAVRIRGTVMQEAVPVGQGCMIAVMGLSDNEVEQMCRWATEESKVGVIEPANYNAPGQVVISGDAKCGEWLRTNYKAELLGHKGRCKFIALNVSAPFHCSLMKPAQEKMAKVLNEISFNTPRFPIVQNVTAKENSDAAELRANLINQISSPVKWTQSLLRLSELGVTRIVEVGPGKVLSGLTKKICGDSIKTVTVQNIDEFHAIEAELAKK